MVRRWKATAFPFETSAEIPDSPGTTTLLTRLSVEWAGEVATQAKQDEIKGEVIKVPRTGETHTWTNDDTSAAATVSITASGP